MRDQILAALVVLLIVASLGVGYAGAVVLGTGIVTTTTTQTKTVTQAPAQNSSEPFSIALVITTGNTFNATVGQQPAYYVLGPGGLQSSAKISLPAHRLIKLVIFNYDNGNASLVKPSYANVQGTTNGTIAIANNATVNSTESSSGISIIGVQTVSSVPASQISHTFTIPSLGINVPVPVSSTVVATFTLNQTGTFLWFCETECGSGPDGLAGAMATPGWMSGAVIVS